MPRGGGIRSSQQPTRRRGARRATRFDILLSNQRRIVMYERPSWCFLQDTWPTKGQTGSQTSDRRRKERGGTTPSGATRGGRSGPPIINNNSSIPNNYNNLSSSNAMISAGSSNATSAVTNNNNSNNDNQRSRGGAPMRVPGVRSLMSIDYIKEHITADGRYGLRGLVQHMLSHALVVYDELKTELKEYQDDIVEKGMIERELAKAKKIIQVYYYAVDRMRLIDQDEYAMQRHDIGTHYNPTVYEGANPFAVREREYAAALAIRKIDRLSLSMPGVDIAFYHQEDNDEVGVNLFVPFDGIRYRALLAKSRVLEATVLDLRAFAMECVVRVSADDDIMAVLTPMSIREMKKRINSNEILSVAALNGQRPNQRMVNYPIGMYAHPQNIPIVDLTFKNPIIMLEKRYWEALALLAVMEPSPIVETIDLCRAVEAELKRKFEITGSMDPGFLFQDPLLQFLRRCARTANDQNALYRRRSNKDELLVDNNYLVRYLPMAPADLIAKERYWWVKHKNISSMQIADFNLRMPPLSPTGLAMIPILFEVVDQCGIEPIYLVSEIGIRTLWTYNTHRFSKNRHPLFVNAYRPCGCNDPKIATAQHKDANIVGLDGIPFAEEHESLYIHETEAPMVVEASNEILTTIGTGVPGEIKYRLRVRGIGRLEYLVFTLPKSLQTINGYQRAIHAFIAANTRLVIGNIIRDYLQGIITGGSACYLLDKVEQMQKRLFHHPFYRRQYEGMIGDSVLCYPSYGADLMRMPFAPPTRIKVWDPRIRRVVEIPPEEKYYHEGRPVGPAYAMGPITLTKDEGDFLHGFFLDRFIYKMHVPVVVGERLTALMARETEYPCLNSFLVATMDAKETDDLSSANEGINNSINNISATNINNTSSSGISGDEMSTEETSGGADEEKHTLQRNGRFVGQEGKYDDDVQEGESAEDANSEVVEGSSANFFGAGRDPWSGMRDAVLFSHESPTDADEWGMLRDDSPDISSNNNSNNNVSGALISSSSAAPDRSAAALSPPPTRSALTLPPLEDPDFDRNVRPRLASLASSSREDVSDDEAPDSLSDFLPPPVESDDEVDWEEEERKYKAGYYNRL